MSKRNILILVLVSFILGGMFSPQIEARRIKDSKALSGFDLFYEVSDDAKANLHILSKRGIPKEVFNDSRNYEVMHMQTIIHNPLTDEAAIQK